MELTSLQINLYLECSNYQISYLYQKFKFEMYPNFLWFVVVEQRKELTLISRSYLNFSSNLHNCFKIHNFDAIIFMIDFICSLTSANKWE